MHQLYLNKERRNSMSKVSFRIFLAFGVLALTFFHTSCQAPTIEELKTYFEIMDMESKWVKKYYSPWPPKLILVPTISFRVKNLSDKPFKYAYFNAIFRQRGEAQNLGDNLFTAWSKKPLMPGDVSDVISMKSNYGVEGKNLVDFKHNPGWKPCTVDLFVKIKGSRYALLGQWEVSKEIDFKEAKPLGPKK